MKEILLSGKNLIMGRLSPYKKPIAAVKPGEVVKIEGCNEVGDIGQTEREYLLNNGVEILPGSPTERLVKALEDVRKIDPEAENAKKWSIHRVTGPIYIEGAEPGDTLEVQILDTVLEIDWGYCIAIPGKKYGREETSYRSRILRYNEDRTYADFMGYELPIHPFFGILGVAADEDKHAAPPGYWGGNIDNKRIVKGTSLYLPVFHEGALFYAGDSHAAQGNGEVSVCALESGSLMGTFRFILHKNTGLKTPYGETPDSFITMGFGETIDEAATAAIKETCALIMKYTGWDYADAFMFASMQTDFELTQCVNKITGIHGVIPKKPLKIDRSDFWNADGSVHY